MLPPASVALGAEWLHDMPQGPGEVPPLGTPPQPVQEFHRRTVTGRTSGQTTQVVEWLYASVGGGNMDGGTPTDPAVRTWVQDEVGLPEDDAGHIIGNRQGGLGTELWNIFPQSRNFNRGVFSADVERTIFNATLHGNVQIWFRFYYDDAANPGRPGIFKYYILFPDGSLQSSVLENPYKGQLMGTQRE